MEKILRIIRKLIPKKLFRLLQPIYHYKMALLAAARYGFPSKSIKVIGVTGTKGKSSTVETINAVLEDAGYKTAVAGTIRFKIGDIVEKNLYKMTMPGRFAIQSFLKRAVEANCDYAVLEMTSEGAKQYRHKFIDLDALVFTNLSPEHIESHGSYEKYKEAKLKIARSIESSTKSNKFIVVNADDKESESFLEAAKSARPFTFSLKDAMPYETKSSGSSFSFRGTQIESPLPGLFNIYNMLAAATVGKALDIDPETIKRGLEKVGTIKGRVERVIEGQDFDVIVDYAHTIDSLEKLYLAFPNESKVCVLGNTGGGRDKWKRTGMAEIAEKYCDKIILTNEDPYDEDPLAIVETMEAAVKDKSKVEIIMDRREAIRSAITLAKNKSISDNKVAVIISGKGTDPYIMAENGKKIPWSDEAVAREELKKII